MSVQKSKLIDLLKCLDAKEVNQLTKYVYSSFVKKRNKRTLILYNYLIKYHPNFQSKKVNEESIYSVLFGDSKFVAKRLRDLMSDLVLLVESYFVQMQLQNSSHLRNRLLADFYADRNIDKYFYKSIKSAEKDAMSGDYRDNEYHKKLFNIGDAIYGYISTSKITQGVDGLKEAIDSLDSFYVYTRYKYNCELVNRSNIVSEENVSDNTSILRQLGKASGVEEQPVYQTFEMLYNALREIDEGSYSEVKKAILANIDQFSEGGKFEVWALFTNYCLKLSRANEDYIQEAFNLYKIGLEEKYLMPNNQLSDLLFMNIVNQGCTLGEQAWVQQFIDSYQIFLPSALRENSVKLNKAYVLFSQHKFDETKDMLIDVAFENVYYNLITRCLLMRVYYESKDWLVLEDFLKSFNVFLRRNQLISNKMKQANLNLVRYTTRLMKRHWVNFKDLSLVDDLTTETNVAYKVWLLQKANDSI